MGFVRQLTSRLPKISARLAAAAVLAGLGTAAAYHHFADDCCEEGAACCYPGSPCCTAHAQQAAR